MQAGTRLLGNCRVDSRVLLLSALATKKNALVHVSPSSVSRTLAGLKQVLNGFTQLVSHYLV